MLLGGVNILGFYSTKANRVWDDTHNQYDYLVILLRGYIPAFQIFVDAATSASVQVYNEQTGALNESSAMVTTQMGSYVRLNFLGLQGQFTDDGYYSLVITTDAEVIYSDVFGWTDTLTTFLKVTAVSSDMAVNPYSKAVMDYADFTYEFYVNAIENEIIPETQEKADERNGISEINYGTTSFMRSFDILANSTLMIFLNYLRMISVNGTVTFTWNGVIRTAKDIEIEKKEVYNSDDLYNLVLKFKDPWETLMVINTIV
jgi:hypothetical protein